MGMRYCITRVFRSMESGEHMPDKQQFMSECMRVLKPGGLFLMATWCHRETEQQLPLSESEQIHLNRLSFNYCLPKWVPPSTYRNIAKQANLQQINEADWTTAILPFWPAVIRSALRPTSILGLLRSGWLTVRGAFTAILMLRGFSRKLLVFYAISARKPK